MKRIRNIGLLILFAVIIAILVSCSMSVKKSFLATQSSFNDMVTSYYQYYKAASPDEQKDLKANVNPKIIMALDVLKKMNEAVRLEINISKIDQAKFQELRYELYKKLPKIFEEG